MGDHGDRQGGTKPEPDYSRLLPGVPRETMIASVDAEPVPDPDGGRNVDHHRALRDD